MLSNFNKYGWKVYVNDVNANMHGSPGARRRLYTAAFSARVVAAAERAGVVYEPVTTVPYDERLTLGDALVDASMIDAHHAELYTGHQLTMPRLYGDKRDNRQVARVDTGRWETEPVGDSRMPAMPMKCFGDTPLVMLPDGRVRRTLLSEFSKIGSVPFSVDRGISSEPTVGEVKAAKTMMGNTWDGLLTRKLVDASLAYMAPFIKERAHEAASPQRLAARFTTIIMRTLLPVRRAWRALRGDHARSEVSKARGALLCAAETAAWWHDIARRNVMLVMRRAVGFMGDVGCATALWKLLMHGVKADDAMATDEQRTEPGKSAGVSKSGSVHLSRALDDAMHRDSLSWTECVSVNVFGMPDIRNKPTQKSWGTRLVLPSEVVYSERHERPLPRTRQPQARLGRRIRGRHPLNSSDSSRISFRPKNQYSRQKGSP